MTLEQLEAQRAARLDPQDLPHTTTVREANEYARQTAVLDQRIGAVKENTAIAESLVGAEAAPLDWLGHLKTWRQLLCEEQLTITSPIRDKAVAGRSVNLTLSIRYIDGLGSDPAKPGSGLKDSGYDLETLALGQLMRDAGFVAVGADPERNYVGKLPWFGSIKEVEARIADIARRRKQAEAAVAEALLDDDARAQRDAESKARIEALNKLPTRKTRGDGSQYDKYPDGRRVEVTTS